MEDTQPAGDGTRLTLRHILTFGVVVVTLGGIFLANLFYTAPVVSQSERRTLATLPIPSWGPVSSAQFMDDFEDYAADSFIGRDQWRTLKALTVFGVYFQTDKSGLYFGDSGAGKFQPINEASWHKAAAKIQRVADSLEGMNIYYSFIPDKSVYAGRYLPGFDPDQARALLGADLPDLAPVDLTNSLSAQDFYRTDLHWDQTKLTGVTATLAQTMGFAPPTLTPIETAGLFSGVYPGQLALPMADDVMTYVDLPESITASYLNAKTLAWEDGPVYDLNRFAGPDPYDLFLRGATPLVTLTNANAPSDKHLYIFRDSFGSSIAPLLAQSYAQVTLIDLRYVDWKLVPDLVDFVPGSDVWFCYSSQILNSESVLLVH
ncbi:MAG: hypothetical protein LBN10_10115 [Propionibacteriaceae bacterium]|nr:hypothetical protein [Propionibacteriaceae bacterium]